VILVTVGTHEQPFDRLLREIDRLDELDALGDEVFCQRGLNGYLPLVSSSPMLPYDEMQRRLEGASAVITHGGPGTVLAALAAGRPLVLVPRQRQFGEHVDDHQVAFCRRIGLERAVPVVQDIADLEGAVRQALQNPPGRRSGDGGDAAVATLAGLVTDLVRDR